jgi:hypothetical protein
LDDDDQIAAITQLDEEVVPEETIANTEPPAAENTEI